MVQALMLTTSRKTFLLERLARDGQLTVAHLADELQVSEDTVRRDLRDLASERKLVRVHGGAVPASPTHLPLDQRRPVLSDAKSRLAAKAAKLIPEWSVVFVDGGTTHVELAAALPRDFRCTIVTHSPAIAMSFEFHQRIEIILIGGTIFRHSMVANGPETAVQFGQIKADLCFLGVTGVHPELGLTTGDSAEGALKRVMLKHAAETVVLATSDKIGRANQWQIAEVSKLATLVTVGDRPEWLPTRVQHVEA